MSSKNKKQNTLKEEKTFAKGICFQKLFIIFIIGCIFGNYYEMILNFIKHYLKDGSIFWEVRRGVIYGPFSPIYGAGAVLMTYCLAERNHKWHQTFIYGAFLGGLAEYIIGFLQETFIGTISWDYSTYFLNINGRTTIPIMLIWGLICLIFVRYIYPVLSKLIERIPIHPGKTIFNIVVILLVIDMTISWTALIRQYLRRNDFPPFTIIGEFYDKVYTDERLKRAFPNMEIPESKVKNK